jgi:CRISPR/Cas system Type II protein with McrA/HNH and RuvC-like nuclease domain
MDDLPNFDSQADCKEWLERKTAETLEQYAKDPSVLIAFAAAVKSKQDEEERAWLLQALAGAPRHVVRKKLRDYLVRLQRGLCYYCEALMDNTGLRPGNPVLAVTLDHKLPQARGGNDTLDNLCAACQDCNNKKGDFTEDEFRAMRAAGLR